MERKCKTCAWYDVHVRVELDAASGEVHKGCCRHQAPVVVVSAYGVADGFPMTRLEDWCRHWSSTTGWEESKPFSLGYYQGRVAKARELLEEAISEDPSSVTRVADWERDLRAWLSVDDLETGGSRDTPDVDEPDGFGKRKHPSDV